MRVLCERVFACLCSCVRVCACGYAHACCRDGMCKYLHEWVDYMGQLPLCRLSERAHAVWSYELVSGRQPVAPRITQGEERRQFGEVTRTC